LWRGLRSRRSLLANTGVALLVRTVFIESVGRHERLFSRFKPARVQL
jgi:hypothetical protein